MRQYFSLVIIFAMLICTSALTKCERGPFEAIIYNVTKCVDDQPWFHSNVTTYTSHGRTFLHGDFITKRVIKDPKGQLWVHANFTIYNSHGRTLLLGYFVTKRELKDLKFSFKANYLEPIKAEGLEAKNLNCHHMIARVVLRTLGVRYNAQKCIMKPTAARFNKIDMDAVIHAIKDNLCYGNFRIKWEIAEPTAKFLCADVYLQIVKPSGSSKRKP